MDSAGKRRSRRRSALKAHETCDDGDTGVLVRKKRVSFSTDLAEVRNFRAQLSSSDMDMVDAQPKVNPGKQSTSYRLSQAAADETLYHPPEDSTLNFDPNNQNTVIFSSQMKTSSTPQNVGPSKRRSSLVKSGEAKENTQDFGWKNREGHVFLNLRSAITLGERRCHLTRIPLSQGEGDMELTHVRDGLLLGEDMSISGMRKNRSKQVNSDLMDMTGIVKNSPRKTRGRKRSQRSRPKQSSKNIPDCSSDGSIEFEFGAADKSAVPSSFLASSGDRSLLSESQRGNQQSQRTNLTVVVKDCTTELGRRDVTDISVLPLPSRDVTLIQPKATLDLQTKHGTEGRLEIDTANKNTDEESESELSVSQFLSSMSEASSLPPVLTARSTAAVGESSAEESGSIIISPKARQLNTSRYGVMGEDTVGLTTNLQNSLSLSIRSNCELPELEDVAAQEPEPTQKELEMAEKKIAQLRKELAEKRLQVALQQKIKAKKQQVAKEKARCTAAQEKFEAAELKFEAAASALQRRNKKNTDFYDVLGKLALMEKLTLWTYEFQPGQLETTKFKFPVGTEFNIAQLSLTVSVDSLENMMFQEYSAALEEVLTGNLMPSYRLEIIKRLLEIVCCECDGLLRTSSLPLLLQMISRLVVRTNSLLEEIELCFLQLGWFEFEPDQVRYRVAHHCDWACYYTIRGLDLQNYPSQRFTFSYEPHLGHVPDRMSELCKSLNGVKPSEKYLTKCVAIIAKAAG